MQVLECFLTFNHGLLLFLLTSVSVSLVDKLNSLELILIQENGLAKSVTKNIIVEPLNVKPH